MAATCSSGVLNLTSVASDTSLSRQTISNHFETLQDTHLGRLLPPFRKITKRKAVAAPKFYLFDLGVTRFLRRLKTIDPNGKDFGSFFEHFIFLELQAYLGCFQPASTLSYWRSRDGHEVDFRVDSDLAIEAQAAKSLSRSDFAGLKALGDEKIVKQKIPVCREPEKRLLDQGILIYPWQEFLSDLWRARSVTIFCDNGGTDQPAFQ